MLPQQPQYSLTFKDLDSGDDAYCSVREVPGAVGITLSLRQSGDVDVFMNWQEAKQFAEFVTKVASLVERQSGPE